MSTPLKVKFHSDKAILPARGSAGAAGYDLCSIVETTIDPRSQTLISIGLSMEIPEGHYARMAPRSGLATRHRIDVGAGVIDSDYRGILQVLLINNADVPYTVRIGDKIAQLILEKISTPDVIRVDELSQTERNISGFGSTGVSGITPAV